MAEKYGTVKIQAWASERREALTRWIF